LSAGPSQASEPLVRWRNGALIAGALGLAACALAAMIPATRIQFFRSYLVAYNLVLGLALGSLAIVMLQHLTGGNWGYILRRPLEAGTRTLPLLAILFVPLALGMSSLYVWTDPQKVALDPMLQHKRAYLNDAFFLVRAGIYFFIWIGLTWMLNRWSAQQDVHDDPALPARMSNLSGPGLILYVVTITFASIDWIMSLEPRWYSTIYGAMFAMGQVLSAFSFAIAVLLLLGTRSPMDRVVGSINLRDLGSLLLAFVMVWAYLSFSQFLLIWMANLPEEVPWYLARFQGGWVYLGLALVLFNFTLPFVLLLSTNIKRNRRRLAAVAFLVLFMRVVDLFWLIVPAFDHGAGFRVHLIDLAALVGVGGLWLSAYLWEIGRRPLLPLHGMAVSEGANHD
jgi:hypothetical protein